MSNNIKEQILNGETVLGLELGSTRIKAVLVDKDHLPIAEGSFAWENHYENGYWTYSLEEVKRGVQACYKELKQDVFQKYGIVLKKLHAIGVSAMMHGYLAFDENGTLLTPFRTWRNTTTLEASQKLSELFQFNIPQRWSVAHLYQAILNQEEHVSAIHSINTLSGYLHELLTSERVLGIGDASGMFPIDQNTGNYDEKMLSLFEEVKGEYSWKLKEILPVVKKAGEYAGKLTEEGALLLDPSGDLEEGIVFCPPEGDAGTGMTATNSVREKTGNVSAGTSIFGMIVLDKPLKNYYPEVDIVTTPDGAPVAMIHCNNCSSDIDAWIRMFQEVLQMTGTDISQGELYRILFEKSLEGDPDCSSMVNFNYVSGEHVTGCEIGSPLFVRSVGSNFNLANFMKAQIYSAFSVLKIGMDLLKENEQIEIKRIYGHGGLFKTKGVAQRYLAASLNTETVIKKTAGEGGPWGMALLAQYMDEENLSLADWLEQKVFVNDEEETILPDPKEVSGFQNYIQNYKKLLPVEKEAGTLLHSVSAYAQGSKQSKKSE